MIWRIFVIAALIIVVAVSVFNKERRPAPDKTEAPTEPLQPGYFMTGARIIETGENGMPLGGIPETNALANVERS